MSSEFGCPECGTPIVLNAAAPGRRVRCDGCGTLLEVPFLPRAVRTPRQNASPPLVPLVVWVLAGFVVLLSLGIIGVKLTWRARVHATANAEMVAIHARAEEAWRADQLDEALTAFDEALGRPELPWDPEVVQSFRERREKAVHRVTERDLERLEQLESDEAVREGLALEARLADDPNLVDERDSARSAVARAVVEWFERDLGEADRALERGEVARAFDLSDSLWQAADTLPYWAGKPDSDRLIDLLKRIAGRYGAWIEPIQGKYRLGSAAEYEQSLRPILVKTLREKGYAAPPSDMERAAVWNQLAPNRLSIEVVERAGGLYLQSANPVAHLECRLLFQRTGKVDWKQAVQAQTDVPLPRLPAFEASRLSVSKTPNPEIQRRFHDNAFETLLGRIRKVVAVLPTPDR